MLDTNAIAQLGYEAYSRSTNNKNFRGQEMPKFDELPAAIKNAWVAATEEIIDVAVKAATA